MKKDIWLPALISLAMIACLLMAAQTMIIVLIFIPGVIAAFLIYRSTALKSPPEPSKILVPYLLAIGIQCLHFAEEFVTKFYIVIPEFIGLPSLPLNDWVIFNMAAYCLFMFGAVVLYKKLTLFTVIPLFFIIVGVFLNTVAHILTSLAAMRYMPGLITVFLYVPLMPGFVRAFRTS